MADVPATIATFTVDRLAFSLSPPVVAAVIDFEGGGRFQCEMTDVDPKAVKIGDRVEMTFRRLLTAEGVHNYFWKARPRRSGLTRRTEERDMASRGIRDRVAIIGMGCTPFGEHWGKSVAISSSTPPPTRSSPPACPSTRSTRSGWARSAPGRAASRCRVRSRSTTSR